MYEPNVARILDMLNPDDIVLDIGGWACPFNRANFVMDAEPYESRGFYRNIGLPPAQGGAEEFFTSRTWIQRDICDREPFPFKDKELDFVICSHTLEDIRDPLWVCSEMVRIAKRGYIEVPTRLHETCRGWENPYQAGLSHHRWLIEINNHHIQFLMKYHLIHSTPDLSFPPAFLADLSVERTVQWLFWEDTFTFTETIIHGIENQTNALKQFVRQNPVFAKWQRQHPEYVPSEVSQLLPDPNKVMHLQSSLAASQHELAAIYGSRAWKVAHKLQQFYRIFTGNSSERLL